MGTTEYGGGIGGASPRDFLSRCSFIDLEADGDRVFQIGAVRGDATFERKGDFDPNRALRDLNEFVTGGQFIAGHNLIGHDWPILRSLAPTLGLLRYPLIDTLYLSPLAFPENPYHALIKDYKLVRDAANNPVADARLSAQVLTDEWHSFRATIERGEGDLISFFRFCLSGNRGSEAGTPGRRGMARIFESLGAAQIDLPEAAGVFERIVSETACRTAAHRLLAEMDSDVDWTPLAYCVAWLRVAGGNSVLPGWVRRHFPQITEILHRLRDVPCRDDACRYCADVHNPSAQLDRYFRFKHFRDKPTADDGSSLQEAIVRKGMSGEPLLAILPTGGGKSLCYQLPALIRNFRRGVLTIVISPLQALMKDQVDNLAARTGSPSVAALYGLLTPPERGEVLERTRMGDIAILYVSPEQLRNRSFHDTIAQREIGCWVFDEAHCLSKWGHDFRPDYLYASRFIREFAEQHHVPIPPVACFTATAKRDVMDEIVGHFQENLGQTLEVYRASFERDNLRFEVQPITQPEKLPRVHDLLAERLGPTGTAVVYAATRKAAEDAAVYLTRRGWRAKPFHAGLSAAEKREIQDGFVRGHVQVICATNAFGMGIDKDDVRVVVHADMPGSLENYIQEAGRAGRDAQMAECILLFGEEDVETQFQLASASQLVRRDLVQILRALRRAKRNEDVVIITSGELLATEDVETSFDVQDRMADTKVRTAVAWLERAGFLERNENRTNVFQGKPLVVSLHEAQQRIDQLGLSSRAKAQWIAVLQALINADGPEGLNADQLAQHAAFAMPTHGTSDRSAEESGSRRVIRILHDMADAGLIRQGLLLSAYVRYKIADSSRHRLEHADAVETALLKIMQEEAPDAEDQSWQDLSLRRLNQAVLDKGLESSPEMLRNLLTSLSHDGKGFAESRSTLEFRHSYQDHYRVKLQRSWDTAMEISRKRRDIARLILGAILAKIPADHPPGKDLLIEFASHEIAEAIRKDLVLSCQIRDMLAAIDRGLMYLHEQKAIILQHGLSVFRQAMTIHLLPQSKGRQYTKGDFDPLAQHYAERVMQVHVMAEYAQRGLEAMPRGLELVASYFNDSRTSFVSRYFAGRSDVIKRAISQEAYQAIVDELRNPAQIAVVAADEEENMLILAGPGSGKTRAVVHRVAYLVRVKRVPARSILVICFNRQAVMELRSRLRALIGTDSAHVTVATYHSLAMRLTGTSFAERCARPGDEPFDFDKLIPAAAQLLRGELNTPGLEPDELRDRLLAGYAFILVDEYQDIDADQYDLISALADRTGKDPDSKLAILAVGDDDQNIYAFRGTNVAFIRRFERDYKTSCHYLVENYRSTANIIAAANDLIARNHDRMKTDRAIEINKKRRRDRPGGDWEKLDSVGQGKVQILRVPADRAEAGALVAEMLRLHSLQPRPDWSSFAVLTRTRGTLHTVRAVCEYHGVPLRWSLDRERMPRLHRIREIASFLDLLTNRRDELLSASELLDLFETTTTASADNPWSAELVRLLDSWHLETADVTLPCSHAIEYIYEFLAEQRREQTVGHGVFLSTIHAAKGTEFDHVLIPSEGFRPQATREAQEEERRLLYVGMTRARKTLTLLDRDPGANPYLKPLDGSYLLHRSAPDQAPYSDRLLQRRYEMLGLAEVFIDFAARHPTNSPVHAAIACLQPGDRLKARLSGDIVELVNTEGRCVGRLAQAASATWAERLGSVEEIRVVAVVRRDQAESKPEFRDACRCDRWEVPLTEAVTAADS